MQSNGLRAPAVSSTVFLTTVTDVIGFLAFRFSLSGVYFALLTIAFAEFTRIAFDHWSLVGGSAGLFLKVENRDLTDIANLRGGPLLFYYVMLSLAVAGTSHQVSSGEMVEVAL